MIKKMNRHVSLTLYSFVAGLLLIELGMQLVGFSTDFFQKMNNRYRPEDAGSYRILTLGESTTAEYWTQSRRNSWPGILERKLNESETRTYRVFNAARGGIRSDTILKELPLWLEEFKPHLVISMIGVNDNFPGRAQEDFHWWEHLKLFKVYQWLKNEAPPAPWRRKLPPRAYPMKFAPLNSMIELPRRTEDIPSFEKRIEEMIRKKSFGPETSYRLLSLFIVHKLAAEKTLGEEMKVALYDVGESWLFKAMNEFPVYHMDLLILGQYLSSRPSPQIEGRLEGVFRKWGLPKKEEIDPLSLGGKKFQDLFHRWGIEIDYSQTAFERLTDNHRAIADLVIGKNIEYVVMSYPTMKIETFKNFFTETPATNFASILNADTFRFAELRIEPRYQNIHWISQENFRESVREKGFDFYFHDHFTKALGGNFGHTTVEGHELITRNILRNSSVFTP